ncbi:hypothetical protein HMPREF2602_06720 [Streptococcus sp. HMSC063D10]|nr:hypothetical protein HMPREF2602_06720 [Streptococcus sp. HMSC063D10]
MVPKLTSRILGIGKCFRAVLFRMVPKLYLIHKHFLLGFSFRAVLFRMVPKLCLLTVASCACFRAVLFRMVPKQH